MKGEPKESDRSRKIWGEKTRNYDPGSTDDFTSQRRRNYPRGTSRQIGKCAGGGQGGSPMGAGKGFKLEREEFRREFPRRKNAYGWYHRSEDFRSNLVKALARRKKGGRRGLYLGHLLLGMRRRIDVRTIGKLPHTIKEMTS